MFDLNLIEKCKSKDPRAQRIFYEQYAPIMMGVCVRYARSQEDAEDVFQEGFVKVFKNLAQFSNQGSFEGWMKRIFINTTINFYKTRSKLAAQVDISFFENSNEIAIEEEVIEKLTNEEVVETIKDMPSGYQMVLNLYAIEGFSHKEIGEMLNISESTSRSQLFKAKKLFQKLCCERNLVLE